MANKAMKTIQFPNSTDVYEVTDAQAREDIATAEASIEALKGSVKTLETEVAEKTTVVANPTLAGTETELNGLEINNTKYRIAGGGGSSSGKYLHCLSVQNVINNILYSALILFVDNNIMSIHKGVIFERLNPQSLMSKEYGGSGSVMNAENKILGVINALDFMGQSGTGQTVQKIRFLYNDTGTAPKYSDWFNPDDTNFAVYDIQLAL